ncbi:carbohydrate ABC transporter permease [Schumannella sp. 10F1B-5-1]|uniref:carbohydrate ABC transporter permease n=1 Tax=Schumannella sp. 10F1B-5-1 TaxID=2590780 RepID=UPI0011328DC7|nr:carbohydrate ABC transporter permease [Schumannella sp. 10F1B-5-1]TPW73140.1 carbohydrate ABC transporter permease [Schumannella sp. 10F1B-5-1]
MTAVSASRASTTSTAPTAPRRARVAPADRVPAVIWHILLIIWSAIVVLPLLWTLMTSFKTTKEIFASPFSLPAEFSFDNYVSAWTSAGIGAAFLQTILVVGSALVLVMLLGAMCAYILARFEFPGNKIIYYLMMAGLTFPIFLAIVPLFFTLQGFGLLNTTPGLILTYVAFALPFTVFFLYSFFKTLPDEIAEAAAVDGASEWRIFFSVMLPMARPGLASVAIFNFLGLWNQFLLPQALNPANVPVLSQAMASFNSTAGYEVNFGALFAGVIITIAPVLVVYLIFQRQLQGSVSQGTMK